MRLVSHITAMNRLNSVSLSNAFELWIIQTLIQNFAFVDFCLEVAKELLQLGSEECEGKEGEEEGEGHI